MSLMNRAKLVLYIVLQHKRIKRDESLTLENFKVRVIFTLGTAGVMACWCNC